MSTSEAKGASRPTEHTPPQSYPAVKARQGEIILKTTRSRIIFFGGLFGGLVVLIVLAIVLGIFG